MNSSKNDSDCVADTNMVFDSDDSLSHLPSSEALRLIREFRESITKRNKEIHLQKCSDVCWKVLDIYSKQLLRLIKEVPVKAEKLFMESDQLILSGLDEVSRFWSTELKHEFQKRGYYITSVSTGKLASHSYAITPYVECKDYED
jgi:aryl carrier-like protein